MKKSYIITCDRSNIYILLTYKNKKFIFLISLFFFMYVNLIIFKLKFPKTWIVTFKFYILYQDWI